MHRDAARRGICVVISLCFILLINSLAVAQKADVHTFTLDATQWNDKPKSVSVAGDFNNWSRDASPLKQAKPNVWSADVKLTEGVHHYKFVIDGERWIGDPNADTQFDEDDNYGGKNSGVLIGLDVRKLPPAQPDHINVNAVLFAPNDAEDVNVFAPGLVRFRVRVQAGDVQTVQIAASWNGRVHIISLDRIATNKGLDVYGGVDVESAVGNPNVSFVVKLSDGKDKKWLTPKGFIDPPTVSPPVDAGLGVDGFTINTKPKFETPDWSKRAVWYQIFPERFRNGDPSNDPGDKPYENLEPWTSDWWATLKNEAPGAENFYKGQGNVWKRRYGGDIQGIKQELPYLRSLGITAIYLNPIFQAESMHKYDTADYRHVDEHFGVKGDLPIAGETDDPKTWKWSGSDKVFLDFVAEAHRQGFKVVCDGVFNHVGRAHPFFQDVVKNGKNSKYADWFEIEQWPDSLPAKEEDFGKPGGLKFKAWDKDSGSLPIFKKDDKLGLVHGPREHVLAIAQRWLAPDGDPSKGIDGWRLDVPGDIPHPFWVEFRKVVHNAKPDAYITGEVWPWAQAWLNGGDQFDAVMNYRFADAAQKFFVNNNKALKPSEMNAYCIDMEFNYPLQVALSQMNLFDSHDTDRAASMYVNPDLEYDASNRIEDNNPKYNPRKPNETEWTRMRQAVDFQMTFIGGPMIYYGDENGMFGPDDPSNRMPMVWKDLEPYDNKDVKFDQTQFDRYVRDIAVREALVPLQLGFYRPVITDNDHGVLAFARDYQGKSVYVIVNRSPTENRVELPVAKDGTYIDWFDSNDVAIKPMSSAADLRPTAVVQSDAKGHAAQHGKIVVELKPYSSMVLSEK